MSQVPWHSLEKTQWCERFGFQAILSGKERRSKLEPFDHGWLVNMYLKHNNYFSSGYRSTTLHFSLSIFVTKLMVCLWLKKNDGSSCFKTINPTLILVICICETRSSQTIGVMCLVWDSENHVCIGLPIHWDSLCPQAITNSKYFPGFFNLRFRWKWKMFDLGKVNEWGRNVNVRIEKYASYF